MYFQQVAFVAVVMALTFCLEAAPIKKRSTSDRVVQFQMSHDDFQRQEWGQENGTLVNISHESKNSFPGSGVDCPTHVLEGANYKLHMRSTCPWYYEVDHETDRYPKTILKARTPCRTCIGLVDEGHLCEAVMRTITILKKSNDIVNGTYQFYESEMKIAVAYTCAAPETVESAPADEPVFAK